MPTCLRPSGKIKELHENVFALLNDKKSYKRKKVKIKK